MPACSIIVESISFLKIKQVRKCANFISTVPRVCQEFNF